VLGLVADGGVIQATYAYEPYGATQASGTDNGNSQQYTARENDGTGLDYYRYRYYMPKTGRFLGEDPTGFRGGPNIYAYAGGNPVQHLDPAGLDWLQRAGGCTGYDTVPDAVCQSGFAEVLNCVTVYCIYFNSFTGTCLAVPGTTAQRQYFSKCIDTKTCQTQGVPS
jgi:RHS repeat-associated protein